MRTVADFLSSNSVHIHLVTSPEGLPERGVGLRIILRSHNVHWKLLMFFKIITARKSDSTPLFLGGGRNILCFSSTITDQTKWDWLVGCAFTQVWFSFDCSQLQIYEDFTCNMYNEDNKSKTAKENKRKGKKGDRISFGTWTTCFPVLLEEYWCLVRTVWQFDIVTNSPVNTDDQADLVD